MAPSTQAVQLRSLLKRGSLESLRTEACHHYEARLTRTSATNGWTVSMSRDGSPRQLERRVNSLPHAAIWIEAWTQSGFAPAPDGSQPAKAAPESVPSPAAQGVVMSEAPGPFVAAGPVAMVTTDGYGLAGGALHLGMPSGHSPWFGATLGIAADVSPATADYRRVLWGGPMVGIDVPLGPSVHLRPALSAGVFGASAKNTEMTANAVGAFGALGTDLVWDSNARWSLFAGVEGRFIFTHFLGGATQLSTHHHDEHGDDESPPAKVDPGVGLFAAGLRFGVIFRFGASS